MGLITDTKIEMKGKEREWEGSPGIWWDSLLGGPPKKARGRSRGPDGRTIGPDGRFIKPNHTKSNHRNSQLAEDRPRHVRWVRGRGRFLGERSARAGFRAVCPKRPAGSRFQPPTSGQGTAGARDRAIQ